MTSFSGVSDEATLWKKVVIAAVRAGTTWDIAVQKADDIVEAYRKRKYS